MPHTPASSQPGEDLHITDLIENAPGWLLRSGTTTLFVVVLLFTALTAFIRYPDKVPGQGIITTEIPPIALLTLEEGRIAELFVHNNDTVHAYDPLLLIANDASRAEVTVMKHLLGQIEAACNQPSCAAIVLPELDKLGMMQNNYAQLKQQHETLRLLASEAEVLALESSARAREVQRIDELNQSLKREQAIFEQELALKEKARQRQEGLHAQAAISAQEYEQQQGQYLQFARQYEGMESGIVRNNIRTLQLETEGLRKGVEYRTKTAAALADIQATAALLRAQLHVWEQRYMVKAEAAGIVAFASAIEPNVFMPAGSLVGHIIPARPGRMVAKISVPVQRSGSLAKGQTMLLKAPAYPYKEHGILSTRIEDISPIAMPGDNGEQYYELRGHLPDTLISSYGQPLAYRPNMQVQAEIVSENKSLFQRIFSQFFNLLQNQ